MKIKNIVSILLLVGVAFACVKEDTICNEEKTIEALKKTLIESVSSQSDYIADEYGITNVQTKLEKLFNDKIQLSYISYHGTTSDKDSEELYSCGVEMSFANHDKFIEFIKPSVQEQIGNSNKWSSEYLEVEHLITYYEDDYYHVFYLVDNAKDDIDVATIDYQISSLLIEYLRFSQQL